MVSVRLQKVRKKGNKTQNNKQAIVAFEVCDEFPLANTFSLTTKVCFLEKTIFVFSFDGLAEVGEVALLGRDEKAGLFCC